MRQAVWFLSLFLLTAMIAAQEMVELEDESESDELAEFCQYLYENPIDLNRATAQELLLIPWLSPRQALDIEAFLKRRRITDPYVLAAEGIIDEKILESILPFIYLEGRVRPGKSFSSSTTWYNRWREGLNEQHPWQNRQRIDYRHGEGLSLFLQSQKDAGEGRWLDYYSGSVGWQSRSKGFFIVAGDYQVTTGLGLALGAGRSRFFYPGMIFIPARTPEVSLHTSSNEWSAFRGLALKKKMGYFSALAAISQRKQDGCLDSLGILQSIYTDGYHRSPSELARKWNVTEKAAVACLGWDRGHLWLNLSGYYLGCRPQLVDGNIAGLSLSGGLYRGRGFFSWEAVGDKKGHQAFSLVAGAEGRYSEGAILAYGYQPGFISPRPGGYEYYGGEDEQGAAVVQRIKLPFGTDIAGLFHWFRPWSVEATQVKGNGGYRLDLKLTNGIIKGVEISYRFRLYDRERIIESESNLLGRELSHLHQARMGGKMGKYLNFHLGFSLSRFLPASSVKWEQGEMLSAGFNWQPKDFLSLSARSSLYYTESYQARLYQPEPELRGMGSFNALWGQGRRDVIYLRYKMGKAVWIEGKAAYTWRYYQNEDIAQTEAGIQVELKL